MYFFWRLRLSLDSLTILNGIYVLFLYQTIVVASCSSSITLLSYLTLHFDEFTQGNQYRPTKIPLNTVRPFEYAEVSQMVLIFKSEVMVVELSNVHEQVVLKDESDIDPNDQNSMLEHLDKVVNFLLLMSHLFIGKKCYGISTILYLLVVVVLLSVY